MYELYLRVYDIIWLIRKWFSVIYEMVPLSALSHVPLFADLSNPKP